MASTSDVNNDELQKLYGNDVFRCEALRNHRGTGKGRKYLVKWLGYPETGNTWEPEINILDKNLIIAYEEKLKSSRMADPAPTLAAPKRRQPAYKAESVRPARSPPKSANKKMKIESGPVGQVSDNDVGGQEVQGKGEDLKDPHVDIGSSSLDSVIPFTAPPNSNATEEKTASSISIVTDGTVKETDDIVDLSQGKSTVTQHGSLVADGHLESIKEELVTDSIETQPDGIVIPLADTGTEISAPLAANGGTLDSQNDSEIPQTSGTSTTDCLLPSSSASSSGRNTSVIVSLSTVPIEMPIPNGDSSEPHHSGEESSKQPPAEGFQELTEVTTGDGKTVTFRECAQVVD